MEYQKIKSAAKEGAAVPKKSRTLKQANFRYGPDCNMLQLQKTVGNHMVKSLLQEKSSVENSGELYEKETFNINEVTEQGPYKMTLWNFNVGEIQLKPKHKAALKKLSEKWKILNLASYGDQKPMILLNGHTSKRESENEVLNEQIALSRAIEVETFLNGRGVPQESIQTKGHGYAVPWFPNIGCIAMAHNRRVEIEIIRTYVPEPKKRDVLNPPNREEKPAIKREHNLGDKLPGISFTKEISIEGPPKPLGTKLILYPEFVWELEFKLKSNNAETFELESDVKGKLAVVAKKELLDKFGTEIKFEGGGDGGNIGFTFNNVYLKPEFEFELVELHKPIAISAELFDTKIPDLSLGNGLVFQVEGKLKFKGALGPGPGLLMSGGTMGIIVGGSIIGTVAITYFTASMVENAKEKGLATAREVAFRDAFAWRVAGEVHGDDGYQMAINHIKEYEQIADAYEYAYQGWSAADRMVEKLRQEQRLEFLCKGLVVRYGGYMEDIQHAIFQRLGGVNTGQTYLPQDLHEFLEL